MEEGDGDAAGTFGFLLCAACRKGAEAHSAALPVVGGGYLA